VYIILVSNLKGATKMKYLDVRVRVPSHRVGDFILELPDWAQLVGVDKLKAVPLLQEDAEQLPPVATSNPPITFKNGYRPQPGGIPDLVLRKMSDQPLFPVDIANGLGRHKAVYSAIGYLLRRKLITRLGNGAYVRAR
jgi:hypothetical protein